MAESDIKLGIYRHFKGNEYEVLFIALDSETLEEKIVYRDINKGTVWVRSKCMWNETVERDGKTFKRFTFINKK
jgi:hypothetical protein